MKLVIKSVLVCYLLPVLMELFCYSQILTNEITKLSDLRALSREEAAKRYPVKVQATVLFSFPNNKTFFVSDDTDAVFVRSAGSYPNILPGYLVEVSGISDPGQLVRTIDSAQITQIGLGKFPKPKNVSIEQALTGTEDARWIEVEGIVRNISQGRANLLISISDGRNKLNLNLRSWNTNAIDTDLINSRIKAEGVCGVITDVNLKPVNVTLHVPYWTNIVFIETNKTGLFDIPEIPISVLASTNTDRAIKIVGEFIKRLDDSGIIIRDDRGEIKVYPSAPVRAEIEDIVEVVGFKEIRNNEVVLADAITRLSTPRRVLTKIKEIKELSPTEANRGYQIDVIASITVFDPDRNIIFVEDDTGGIFVHTQEKNLNFRQFEIVKITGTSEQGIRKPYIKNAQFIRTGEFKKPPAKEAQFKDLIRGDEDSNFVQIRGIVHRSELRGIEPRLLIATTNEGKLYLVVHERVSVSKLNSYEDCEIVAEGTCGLTYKSVKGDLTVDVHLQSLTNIVVLKRPEIPLEKIKPLSVSSLINTKEPLKHRIVVEGTVYTDKQGKHWISDAIGELEVEFNYLRIPAITNIARIAGFFTKYKNQPLIEDAVLLLKSNPETNQQPAQLEQSEPVYLPLITEIPQIKTMHPEDAAKGYPIWITATVTYCDGEQFSMFIHDGNVGLHVNLKPYYFRFSDGEHVEIFGYTGAGNFAPEIREPIVKSVGKVILPIPKVLPIRTLLTGAADSEYIKLKGVVRNVYIRDGHLHVEFSSEGEKLRAVISGYWKQSVPTNLLDSEVSITGVCSTLFNQNRQAIGTQLFVQDINKVEIIKPGTIDPFESTSTPIANLLRYSPDFSGDHRVKIEGEVTYFEPGRLIAIQDSSGGIFVETECTDDISAGDYVYAAGFIKREGYTPKLENGIVKKIKKTSAIKPIPVNAAQALSIDPNKPVIDGKLIKTTGKLIDRITEKTALVFVLQDGSVIFRASINTNVSMKWFSAFRNGDVIEVTGVCKVQTDSFGTPQSFSVLLRSPNDITLLESAPWFDEKKLIDALKGLVGVIVISYIWVAILKSKIKKQNEEIRKQNEELERRVAERTAELNRLNNVLKDKLNELEKAKTEIEKREKLYRTLFESSQDAIFVEDYEGTVLDVNPAACKLHGMSREELIGKNVTELVTPSQIETVKATFKKFISGELTKTEGYSLTKNGLKVPVILSVSRIEYNGKPALLFNVKDVTEIKKAQEELKSLNENLEKMVEERTINLLKTTEKLKQQIEERIKAEQALRESEERFSKAFNLNPIGSILLSLDTETILAVNDAFCRLVGFTKEQLIGKTLDQFAEYFSYEIKQKILKELQEKGTVLNHKTRITNREGKNLDTLISGDILTIGNRKCVLLTINDITRLSEIEAQLHQKSKMQAVGMLAAGIAHDFNNMLTVVQGHAGLISMNETVPEQVKMSAETILTISKRASDLVKKLLTFSRQTKPNFKMINLNKAIEETANSMLSRLSSDNVRFVFNFEENLPNILADRTMLDEIIINLSLNARDAMPNGGTIIYSTSVVEIKPDDTNVNPKAKPGKYVCLSVKDTGHGMDETVKSRIFEPFFTTKEFGKGCGLGMAIVYGIVEQHNGWIELESAVGAGTNFRIYFPVAETAPEEEVSAPKQISEEIKPQKKYTILLVEDDKNLRFLLRHLLEKHDFRVVEAESGEEALKIWNIYKDEIDLLFTDIIMPDGMDGHELAQKLKKMRPNLKVLYSSGYSPAVLNPEYNLIEGVNFVYKPYNPKELISAIHSCLQSNI